MPETPREELRARVAALGAEVAAVRQALRDLDARAERWQRGLAGPRPPGGRGEEGLARLEARLLRPPDQRS